MKSKWIYLKPKALRMRRRGFSIRAIENKLSIPRSTLSGWFKHVVLAPNLQKQLEKQKRFALIRARQKAILWHNSQKAKRQDEAMLQARMTLEKVNVKQREVVELTLAMLYWGEGGKRERGLVIGNSDSQILKFFINALQMLYQAKLDKMQCELHLRADQNSRKTISHWSRELGVPKSQFKRVYYDKRSDGKRTYDSYFGVCVIAYNDVAIQRKLMYLYQLYCQKIIQRSTVSSVGRARL